MDPVTGIGLAASVIQLVQFGISTVKICRELHQNGSLSSHEGIKESADHLANIAKALKQSRQQAVSSTSSLSRSEQELANLAKRCEGCATRLQQELQKYELPPQRSSIKSASKTLRVLFKGDKLQKLQEELEADRKVLETSLLSDLSRRFDLLALENGNRFAMLDKALQILVQKLACGQTSLQDLMIEEFEKSRQHFDARFAWLEQLHIDESARKEEYCWYNELTQSLFYSDITARQEQIDEGFDGIEDTYDWIFEDPKLNNRGIPKRSPFNDFREWLRAGRGAYWINGKAGAGKSTLMNRICDHSKTRELLEVWGADDQLLVPTHFFWNSGTQQQRNITGLLRSLIYQILKDCRQLAKHIEAIDLFNTVITITQVPIRICIFIDGLDEYEGRFETLVDTIKILSNQPRVKMCLSSRPLRFFEKTFAESPSLRLQDFTCDAISAYASQQLLGAVQERFSVSEKSNSITQGLVLEITSRAQGVFLWVVVAVRLLREGLLEYANFDELWSAFNSLPAGIESLFMKILRSIKPNYRQQAIKFLKIVIFDSESYGDVDLDLFSLLFMDSEQGFQDSSSPFEQSDRKAIREGCRALKVRLSSHTLGLVDVTSRSIDIFCDYYEKVDYDLECFEKVQFHHRSVKEFLLTNYHAKEFLASAAFAGQDIHLWMAKGFLRNIQIVAREYSLDIFDLQSVAMGQRIYEFLVRLTRALQHIAEVEEFNQTSQYRLMQSICNLALLPSFNEDRKILVFNILVQLGKKSSFLDVVAVAVEVGMWRFVSEVLGIDGLKSIGDPHDLSDFQQLCSAKTIEPSEMDYTIALKGIADPFQVGMQLSEYVQIMSEHITETRHLSHGKENQDRHGDKSLLATYLIRSCCKHRRSYMSKQKLRIVSLLLQAGADPMARPRGPNPDERTIHHFASHTFWSDWLAFIYWFGWAEDGMVGLDDVWQVTRELLVSGADINYEVMGHNLNLGDLDSSLEPWQLQGTVKAIWILQEIFECYSEFRAFNDAALVSDHRVWTTLYSYCQVGRNPRMICGGEERDRLLDTINMWLFTRKEEDKVRLRSALEDGWAKMEASGTSRV